MGLQQILKIINKNLSFLIDILKTGSIKIYLFLIQVFLNHPVLNSIKKQNNCIVIKNNDRYSY